MSSSEGLNVDQIPEVFETRQSYEKTLKGGEYAVIHGLGLSIKNMHIIYNQQGCFSQGVLVYFFSPTQASVVEGHQKI